MSSTTTALTFNGVNGATGDYLLPPMTPAQIARLAQGETLDDDLRTDLRIRHLKDVEKKGTLRIIEGLDTSNLAHTGWGVIFAQGANPAIREALSELLDHRRAQATADKEERYREFTGEHGYWMGETAYGFLSRFGAGPGPANPDKVPYYLLIVGDPETIPYSVQYQLDVERAVGRIRFETLEDYARYARSVVQAETSVTRSPRAVFFGVENPDDAATHRSNTSLVGPLADALKFSQDGWVFDTIRAEEATQDRLLRLIGQDDTPALLFTASHGMGFPPDDARLLPHQGALLCQDWPGPKQHAGEIPEGMYVSGDHIADDAHVLGMIGFHFACYGAGTPRLDDFAHHSFEEVAPIAPHAFVAKLPQRLLSHPKGGALAFVGHIERTCGYSFDWPGAGPQIDVFESTIHHLMQGKPLGAALEYFNGRYAEIATILTGELDVIKQTNRKPDEFRLAQLWISNNDARGYAIIGDPAVRLATSDSPAAGAVTEIEPVTVVTPSPPPAQPVTPTAAPADTTLQAESHGLLWGEDSRLKELPARLAAALEKMTTSVSSAIQAMFHDVSSFHVETYTSEKLEDVTNDRESRRLTGPARRRAISHIGATDDTVICVPDDVSDAERTMWEMHVAAMRQAHEYRAGMLKTAISAASSLLASGKPG